MREFDVEERSAKLAVAVILRAIDGVLAEWRYRPTPQFAARLENMYVTMALGAKVGLAVTSYSTSVLATDTFANVDELIADVGYKPDTPIEVGVRNFVDWFLGYYKYG